jgi:phosphatidylserine decarboxylase
MQTTWHGIVNPPRSKEVREWTYDDQTIVIKKGEEMGRFLLGSTVVMLFTKDSMHFNSAWKPTGAVCLGEEMGS